MRDYNEVLQGGAGRGVWLGVKPRRSGVDSHDGLDAEWGTSQEGDRRCRMGGKAEREGQEGVESRHSWEGSEEASMAGHGSRRVVVAGGGTYL